MGILNSLLGKREPAVAYRTVDGGHPAPYPDMTDEQLYNYEIAFNVPQRTFDKPPPSMRRPATTGASYAAASAVNQAQETRRQDPRRQEPEEVTEAADTADAAGDAEPEPQIFEPRWSGANVRHAKAPERADGSAASLPPLDFSRPIRTVTTRQRVEIITTRARHPVFPVHGYIGDDNVVTVFTAEGQLAENGLRFLENVPEEQQLYLNIYPNPDPYSREKYLITQHASREEADARATSGRIICIACDLPSTSRSN